MGVYGSGLVKSMRIAFRNMMRTPITVQYPHQRIELPERARWAVAQRFHDDGTTMCTACMACEKACPDFVIAIDVTTAEDRAKHVNSWRYEIGACMMCGLCVEACPYDAIYMGHDYELARIDPSSLVVDLLVDVPADQPKRRAQTEAQSVSGSAAEEA